MWLQILYSLAAVLALGILGHLFLLFQHRDLVSRITFLNEFEARLVSFFQRFHAGDNIDEDFTWLQAHSVQMQEQMGPLGWTGYKPPMYAPGTGIRIQVVHGCLTGMVDEGRGDTFFQQLMQTAFVRYGGHLRHEEQEFVHRANNPVRKVLYGIRALVLLLPWLAKEAGLLSTGSYSRLERSFIVGLVSFSVTIVGIVGSLFSIIAGWDAVINWVRSHL